MKIQKCFGVIFAVLLFSSCANTAKNLNSISVGMTKPDVITVMGDPEESRASDGKDYLIYRLRKAPSGGAQAACGVGGYATLGLTYLLDSCKFSNDDYFVQFANGKVDAYGRLGDFNTLEKADQTIKINQTHQEIK